MKAVNIIWDTDGENIALPFEIYIPNEMTDEDEISDYITDETGFCHCGFELVDSDESYTAFVYGDDGITTEDLSTYDDKDEAIEFAKSHDWDEVVNDITGEVVWKR